MWQSARKTWPDDDQPVAAWESDRLFVAKRVGGDWYECSEVGDVHYANGGGPIMCDPERWCHLPARLVKLKRRGAKSAEASQV